MCDKAGGDEMNPTSPVNPKMAQLMSRRTPFNISLTGITVAARGSMGMAPGSAIAMKSFEATGITRILRISS